MGDRMRQIRVLIAVDDFLPSREFQNRVPDLRNRAAVEALITRFYTQLLRRDPEPDGLDAWTDFVVDTGDLEPVVVGFLISAEFEAQPPTFRGYLTLLYRALLGREPDPGVWTPGRPCSARRCSASSTMDSCRQPSSRPSSGSSAGEGSPVGSRSFDAWVAMTRDRERLPGNLGCRVGTWRMTSATTSWSLGVARPA